MIVFRKPKEILASTKAMKIKAKYWKKLDIAKTIAFLVVLSLACISLLTLLPLTTPIKPYIVLTGSMNPTVPQGSIVFVKRNFGDLKVGQVITFINPSNVRENVTHRIISIKTTDKKTVYATKGDANLTPDLWTIRSEAILGKALYSFPMFGYLISFSRTRLGVILTIALPLIIIALDEMRVIYTEIKKLQKIQHG